MDTKIEALIQLLDDTDPEVTEAVEIELKKIGNAALVSLEAALATCQDELQKNRIELIIQDLYTETTTERLLQWRMAGGIDLLEGWLAFSAFENPNLPLEKYKNAINRLVNKVWLQTVTSLTVLEKFQVISQFLFYDERFIASVEDIEEPKNNCLDYVLDKHKSNTLGYSALYFCLCQKLDIPLQIVNFSGYYALRHYNGEQHFYIDPFNKGIIFSSEEVQVFLEKLQLESNLMTYKPMSNIYVILDMIRFSTILYKKMGNDSKAFRLEKLIQDIDVRLE